MSHFMHSTNAVAPARTYERYTKNSRSESQDLGIGVNSWSEAI